MVIKAIDGDDVHRICSGQVITSLESVVKELVENALDSGASSVEVRARNNGLESVEVIDNGSGIKEEDLPVFARKHFTSKLGSFADIDRIDTLGFRGEALSSICALGDLKITTATKETHPMGTALEFDHYGSIKECKKVARQEGTTASVTDLFHTLPVRRKEFERHAKREFTKVHSWLQTVALINSDVRVSLTTQSGKNSHRSSVFSTQGGGSLVAAASQIFGFKAVQTMQEFHLEMTLEPRSSMQLAFAKRSTPGSVEFNEERDNDQISLVVEGLISKVQYGLGRSSNDRQYIYLNKRPVNLPKVLKVFNEIFKEFNHHQYPSVVANLIMAPSTYDVNVTPDKRTVFLHHEVEILDELRDKLRGLWGSGKSVLQVNSLATDTPEVQKISPAQGDEARHLTKEDSDADSQPALQEDSLFSNRSHARTARTIDSRPSSQRTRRSLTPDSSPREILMDTTEASWSPNKRQSETTHSVLRESQLASLKAKMLSGTMQEAASDVTSTVDDSLSSDPDDIDVETHYKDAYPSEALCNDDEADGLVSSQEDGPFVSLPDGVEIAMQDEPNYLSEARNAATVDEDEDMREVELEGLNDEVLVNVDLEAIRKICLQKRLVKAQRTLISRGSASQETREAASLANIDDPSSADQALSRMVDRSDFDAMEILGQFNRGFIIARRKIGEGVDDLFIIDQHASDEKYNFEMLSKQTKIEGQTLVRPLQLDLTAMEENTAYDYRDTLAKNGFMIQYTEDAPAMQRVQLLSLPISKNTVYTTKDFEELLHLLSESSGSSRQSLRPSRTRSMFAMRACKKSVKIGMALKKDTMTKIVRNMGTMEQPWNCPHGRPTMRHLYSLASRHRGSGD